MKPSFKNNNKKIKLPVTILNFILGKNNSNNKRNKKKTHFFPFPTLEALYKNSTYILLEHLKILFVKIYQDFHTKPLNGENFYLRKHNEKNTGFLSSRIVLDTSLKDAM